MKILFADDCQITALPVILYLQKCGYTVTHVENGQQAVDSYLQEMPDLILMDVMIPVMDGIEATKTIRTLSEDHWIPIMMMTELHEQEDILKGFDAGADDYVIKPVNLRLLLARLNAMRRVVMMQESLFNILDNVFEGIITIDQKGLIKSFNRAAERIFGYHRHEIMGKNIKCLMPKPHSEQHDSYLERYQKERVKHIIGVSHKVQGLRKNGEVFAMRLSVTEIRRNHETFFIGLVSDISEEEIDRQQVEFLAMHDSLTGLPNRVYLNETLELVLHSVAKHQKTHAILFIDLDGFKPINDELGHDCGDAALKIIAQRLRNHLPADDFVARIGGDEFVILCYDVDTAENAVKIAERLLEAIKKEMVLNGYTRQMSASIGIALMPQHGRTVTELLTLADKAMYQAKRQTKGSVVLADLSE